MSESEAAKKEEEAKMLAELMAEDQMCEEAPRVFTWLLTGISILLVIITAPLSLLFVLKVVQVGTEDDYLYRSLTMSSSGIRESSNIPPGPHSGRRREGSRDILHLALHGPIRDCGHEGPELVRAPTGDDHQVGHVIIKHVS